MTFSPTNVSPVDGSRAEFRRDRPWRGDIDGLRTLAVAGVIAFHYGLGPFPGGYAGVDVFLVISGYLITSLLVSADRRDRFSLADFFVRRARRLLPALLLVLLACAIGALRLLPSDMKSIGAGLMNAAVFTSNIFLGSLAQTYFAAGSLAIHPELHTWSLALEAQFYVAFALMFAALRHRRHWLVPGLAALALLSLAFGIWGVSHVPGWTFYLLPGRFWEFLAGAAVYGLARRSAFARAFVAVPALAALALFAGLALIFASYLFYTQATPFPGLAAALPCAGAMLVIAAGERTNAASAVLALPPLPQIGRISYALYLWHWPVLVFASYGRASALSLASRLALLALSVLLAIMSSALVERPIIERRWLTSSRGFASACIASILAVMALGLIVNLAGQNKIPLTLLPPRVVAFADARFDAFKGECGLDDLTRVPCRFGAGSAEPTVLLWGNSFARMWLPALDLVARRHGLAGESLLLSKCPPLLDRPLPNVPGCAAFDQKVFALLDQHPTIRTVVLGANWPGWADDLDALGPTVDRLRAIGRKVVVIASPPVAPFDVPRTLAMAELQHTPVAPSQRARALASRKREDEVLARLRDQDRPDVAVVDPAPAFCEGDACSFLIDGQVLYFDESHITNTAAKRFSWLFDKVLGP